MHVDGGVIGKQDRPVKLRTDEWVTLGLKDRGLAEAAMIDGDLCGERSQKFMSRMSIVRSIFYIYLIRSSAGPTRQSPLTDRKCMD